ncbi:MAG TPA: ABC transporter permease subunit [Streptosporangiaceae bacterium]|nr:ABC transporter permease subunit [Streptosporangiaceae bacterium]
MGSHGAHPPFLIWKAMAARWQRGLAGLAAFLLLAQLLGSSGVLSRSVLPLASTVLTRAAGLAVNPQFLADLAATLEAWAAGLAIATAVGVPLGIALGRSAAALAYLEPLLHFGRSMPAVAFVTVFTIVFSLGTQSEIAFIAFGTTWPILLNTIDGARSVDPQQAETARAFRLPLGSRITKLIVLPRCRGSSPGCGSASRSPSS